TPAVGFAGTDSFTYQANDGAANSNIATVTITVTQPATTLGRKVTGGGSISGATQGQASFNLNPQADDNDGTIKGTLQYGGSSEGVYIRSTSITGMVFTGTSVRIFGKATVNGAGSFDFVADVTDNGEPGNNDTFAIRLSNGYTNGPKTLTGGNIQVHK
ncbi:MAG TPA: post-COAP-1 domain-containing protein, partial [Abditibacteriaceae bacterium]